MTNHLFSSPRLGFREWSDNDLDPFYKMNSDPTVMEFFPSVLTRHESDDLMRRIQRRYAEQGFCYYAVDELVSGELIGFIGLTIQSYEAPFTPCVDIGWRLIPKYWGKGYATEGANRCLQIGFENHRINEIYSIASLGNVRSISVMQKVGMSKTLEFDHPNLSDYVSIRKCAVYKLTKDNWLSNYTSPKS